MAASGFDSSISVVVARSTTKYQKKSVIKASGSKR